MAIQFDLIGTRRNSNDIVLNSKGGNGKPAGSYVVIDADKADSYISKRKSLDKKESVLSWGMLISTLGAAALVCEKFKFGGQIGKTLATMATGLTGLALSVKLSTLYKKAQHQKLDDKFEVQRVNSLDFHMDPDFERLEKFEAPEMAD